MRASSLLTLLTVLALTGCASVPEVHYYMIGRPAGIGAAAEPLSSTGLTIGVPRFEAEGIYARDNLLYRSGEHEIAVDYYRRWGTPVQKMLAETTVGYLRSSGSFAGVLRLPSMSRVDLVLAGRILRFEHIPEAVGSHVRVDFEFCLKNPANHSILWRMELSETATAGVAPSAEVLVAAYETCIHSCLKRAVDAVAQEAAKYSSQQ
ncbi:MAG: ABC-type transport auxiliary lipoprotein family protein [Gemmatimonadota bacterium]|nr:ABC-type transport auxiliary lipoprotein family protein [Gemmatimonadota bacterium]